MTAIGWALTGASTSSAAMVDTGERGLPGGIPRRAARCGLVICLPSYIPTATAGLQVAVSLPVFRLRPQRCVT